MALKKVDVNEVQRQREERKKELARRADESYAYSVKRRHRYERHRAVGLLSRGVALILIFIVILVAFGLLDPLFFGVSQASLVVPGGAFDGSDVMLDTFRFSDVSSSFGMIDKAFKGIEDFCYPISQFFYSSFGLGYEVIFLFSDPLTGNLYDSTRDYIIVRSWNKLPVVRHKDIVLSSITGAYSFAVSVLHSGLFVVYDIDDNLIGEYHYHADFAGSFGTVQYITYSRAIYASRQWLLYADVVLR